MGSGELHPSEGNVTKQWDDLKNNTTNIVSRGILTGHSIARAILYFECVSNGMNWHGQPTPTALTLSFLKGKRFIKNIQQENNFKY